MLQNLANSGTDIFLEDDNFCIFFTISAYILKLNHRQDH